MIIAEIWIFWHSYLNRSRKSTLFLCIYQILTTGVSSLFIFKYRLLLLDFTGGYGYDVQRTFHVRNSPKSSTMRSVQHVLETGLHVERSVHTCRGFKDEYLCLISLGTCLKIHFVHFIIINYFENVNFFHAQLGLDEQQYNSVYVP